MLKKILINKKEYIGEIFIFIGIMILIKVSFSRSDFFLEYFENLSLDENRLILTAFVVVLIGYGIIFFENIKSINRWHIFFIGILSIICLIAPPLLSRDVGAYLLGAKNFVWFHLNPYFVSLNFIQDSLWVKELGQIWWLKYPYAYGPAFLLITSISILPNPLHLIEAVYFYKIIVFLAYIFSIFIFSKIVKELKLNKTLIFLYAINPAILINGLFDGHNEIFIIVMLLCLIYFFVIKKEIKSYLFWLIAVFIKYNVIIFLPVFWNEKAKINFKKVFFSSLFLGASFVVFFWLLGFTSEVVLNNFLIMKSQLQNCLYRCSPIISITDMIAGDLSGFLRILIFIFFYLYFLFKFIINGDNKLKFIFWTYLTLVFTLVRWISPWYVLPIIPIGILLGEKKYHIITFLITIYSLLHFFGIV